MAKRDSIRGSRFYSEDLAPVPVSNADFTHALGHALGRPTIVPVPQTAIHLMFGEMGEQTILASQRVVPTRLLGAGFSFHHETIDAGLRSALANEQGRMRPA